MIVVTWLSRNFYGGRHGQRGGPSATIRAMSTLAFVALDSTWIVVLHAAGGLRTQA